LDLWKCGIPCVRERVVFLVFVAAAVCACSELVGFLELQYEICKRLIYFMFGCRERNY
jgi:hypothetical protein